MTGIKFLVIVDDFFFHAKIGETIRQLGGNPVFAADINEIPDDIDRNPPNAIIVDLNLSKGNPIALISHFRSIIKIHGIPIVAYGRHTNPEGFDNALKAGCNLALPRSEFVKQLPGFVGENISVIPD